MFFIRQGATHKVVLGPAVAVGDGFTPVTNLDVSTADEAEAILHDNGTVVDISGYTWAAIATADGYYHLTLQAAISGTVGHLTIVVNDDSLILPLRADFTVMEEAPYDAMYKASAVGPVLASLFTGITSVAQWLGLLAGKQAGDATALTEIKATGAGSGTYDPTTDSPEAARDRGDSAWITATGFSTHNAAAVKTAIEAGGSSIALMKAVTDALTAAAAAKLALSAAGIVTGAVEAGTLSTTQMTTDLSEATDDHYIGAVVVWTSGVLAGQRSDITDYAGANGLLSFTAVTEAPSATDTFVIL